MPSNTIEPLPRPPGQANAAQIDFWNTTTGATWVAFHDALDAQLAPLGRAAMDALAPIAGERVIDIGCGCGHTTVDLAARVGPTGGVLGVDISRPMLEVARNRAVPATSAAPDYREADAQTADFVPHSFDALYSRFGVMFFADPVAAFANLHGALKPAGRLAFVCWRSIADNPSLSEPLEAALPILPPRPPFDPLAPGPFAFSDPERVKHILTEAGFVAISANRFDTLIGQSDVETTLSYTLRIGPLGSALRENPDKLEAISDAVRGVLERHVDAKGLVRIPAAVWIVTARAS